MSDQSERDLAERLGAGAESVFATYHTGIGDTTAALLDFAAVVAELTLRASLQPGTFMDMTRAVDRIIAAAKAGE